MIKMIIADDQELIRQSLSIVLNASEEFMVIGSARNGQEVLDLIKQEVPDIVLMDIRMPVIDGVECTRMVKEKYPWVKVIILTTFLDDEYVFQALKHGASGYLLKDISMDDLKKAIITVYKGGAMINPEIASKVLDFFSEMAAGNMDAMIEVRNVEDLTDVEWKIIEYVGRGLSNKDIAKQSYLSEGTVRNYVSQILKKLELQDRTQLAIWQVQAGSRKYRGRRHA